VQELAARVTAGDEALLLELFSNPDPLVRETRLRALKDTTGPAATAALTRLLSDPEPNVRAAVLKQLAEQPVPGMVGKVVEFVRREKDPDLLVHAVRALRGNLTAPAIRCLLDLLGHDTWQVRAEAAESLSKFQAQQGNERSEGLKADIYVAMVKLLDDPDIFVISRAIPVVGGFDLAVAVEPLVGVVANTPTSLSMW
jgi:HEAT repeat protein